MNPLADSLRPASPTQPASPLKTPAEKSLRLSCKTLHFQPATRHLSHDGVLDSIDLEAQECCLSSWFELLGFGNSALFRIAGPTCESLKRRHSRRRPVHW